MNVNTLQPQRTRSLHRYIITHTCWHVFDYVPLKIANTRRTLCKCIVSDCKCIPSWRISPFVISNALASLGYRRCEMSLKSIFIRPSSKLLNVRVFVLDKPHARNNNRISIQSCWVVPSPPLTPYIRMNTFAGNVLM